MKKVSAILLALVMAVGLVACSGGGVSQADYDALQQQLNDANAKISELEGGSGGSEEGGEETPTAATGFDAEGLIDWYNESYTWMTVNNGSWSSDPADQISDAELERIFSMATKQQNAVHWTPYFYIVVKDVEEQRNIIGDGWGDPEDMATEGTVTVLVMVDQILLEEEGHATPYEGTYMPTNLAPFDAGMTTGVLGVAAGSLGYYTHHFGSINGVNAPADLADGRYQSMSYYVKDEYTRVWGFRSEYGEEPNEDYVYPVLNNCVFVDAVVIGVPDASEDIETWGTWHARPDNWAIWDN